MRAARNRPPAIVSGTVGVGRVLGARIFAYDQSLLKTFAFVSALSTTRNRWRHALSPASAVRRSRGSSIFIHGGRSTPEVRGAPKEAPPATFRATELGDGADFGHRTW